MSTTDGTKVEIYEIKYEKGDSPIIFDPMSLAFNLNMRLKTVYGVVMTMDNYYNTFGLHKKTGNFIARDHFNRYNPDDIRVIDSPKLSLRCIHTQIRERFLKDIKFGDHVAAYVPGKSILNTAVKHVGNEFKIEYDIKNFFPSITRANVSWWFRKQFNMSFVPSNLIGQLCTYNNKLPQGSTISPILSNAIADATFDKRIIGFLNSIEGDWVYSRYADNLIISCKQSQSKKTEKFISDMLYKIVLDSGFTLHTKGKKTPKGKRPHQRQQVLGIVVNSKVNVPRKKFNRLRAIIHNCKTYGFTAQFEKSNAKDMIHFLQIIRGQISYVNSINPEKGKKLNDKLEEAMGVQKVNEVLLNS